MPTVKAYANGLSLGWAGGRQPCVNRVLTDLARDRARKSPDLRWFSDGCCHEPDCACAQGERVLCCRHVPAKRDKITGWSEQATRGNTNFLRSIDTPALTGTGYAFTLTLRDIPATPQDYARAVDLFMRRMRNAGCLRWHRVLELTKRRRPHTHGSVYFEEGWLPPQSDITYIIGHSERLISRYGRLRSCVTAIYRPWRSLDV